MKNTFAGGVWPVMITPFTPDNQVDYPGLERLVDWYIDHKVAGLFAACQSSEIFCLSLEERVKIAQVTVKAARGRIPVIASGHVSDSIEEQAAELNAIAKTGVQALILISNRLATQEESDAIWLQNLQKLLSLLNNDLPLGFYECPYPYKRLLSPELISYCSRDERFQFIKDTCCDSVQLTEKLELLKNSNLKLYNANTTTLLDSLRGGAAGYSGVMANFHPEAYVWLCENYQSPQADELLMYLSIGALLERQCYPVSAKYHLGELEKLGISTRTRTRSDSELTQVFKTEIQYLDAMITDAMKRLIHG